MIDDHEFEDGSHGRCQYTIDGDRGERMICGYKRKSHLQGSLSGYRRWLWKHATASPLAWEYADAVRALCEYEIAEYTAGRRAAGSLRFAELSRAVWDARQHIGHVRETTIRGLVQYRLGYWPRMRGLARQRWELARQLSEAKDSGPR
jgi:hypothetical protein